MLLPTLLLPLVAVVLLLSEASLPAMAQIGNWSIPDYTGPQHPSAVGPQYPSVEGKVITSGSKRPVPANTFDKPSLGPEPDGGYASFPRPPYPELQRYTNAINALAQAIDSLGNQVGDIQGKVDYLLEPSTTPRPFAAPTPPQAPPNAPGVDNRGCSSPFERVGNECYYFSVRDYHRANWQDAYMACQGRGAALATLDTTRTYSQLARHLSSSATTASYRFWLGGLFPGIAWHWVYTGEPMTLLNSQWTTTTSSSHAGARAYSYRLPDFFDLSNDNPLLTSILSNITRVVSRNGHHSGAPIQAGDQQSQTTSNGGSGNATAWVSEGTSLDRSRRQSVTQRESSGTATEHRLQGSVQQDVASPLMSLLDPAFRTQNSQVESKQYREVREAEAPWSVDNGRCLLFQSITDRRTFKFAADQCGYDQYYICQQVNEI